MSLNPITLTAVTQLIAECWKQSEDKVRESIRLEHNDLYEDLITRLFYDEFKKTLNRASIEGLIEKVFLKDLKRAFPSVFCRDYLKKISDGIVATVTMHLKNTEERTGGDLGLVLIRPNVIETFIREMPPVPDLNDYRHGLLCQAKVRRRDGRWGPFSKN